MRVVLKYRSSFSAESTKNLAQRPTCTPVAPQKGNAQGEGRAGLQRRRTSRLHSTALAFPFRSTAKAPRSLFQIEERRQFAHLLLKARKKKCIMLLFACTPTNRRRTRLFTNQIRKSKLRFARGPAYAEIRFTTKTLCSCSHASGEGPSECC